MQAHALAWMQSKSVDWPTQVQGMIAYSLLIFWLSYRIPRLSASSSLIYSPIYSHMKLPRGMKSGLRTPQPLTNLDSRSMHRITSRRKFGPRCTRRFLHSIPQPLARVHSYTESMVCGGCKKRLCALYAVVSALCSLPVAYGQGHGSRMGPPRRRRNPSLTTHSVTYVKSTGAGSKSAPLKTGIGCRSWPRDTSKHRMRSSL